MYRVEHDNHVETGGIITLFNDKEEVGHLKYIRDDESIKITWIYVEPPYRKKRISKELLIAFYKIFSKELKQKYILATSREVGNGLSREKWANYLVRMGIRMDANWARQEEADRNRRKMLRKLRINLFIAESTKS